MQHRSLLAFLVAASPMTIAAQESQLAGSLPDRVAYCTKDRNDIGRLACFDALAVDLSTAFPVATAGQTVKPALAPVQEAAPATAVINDDQPPNENPQILRNDEGKIISINDWTVLRNVDPLTDRLRVSLVVRGETTSNSSERPSLFLRCKDDQFEAFVTMPAFFGISDSRQVRFRVDREPPVSQTWSPSVNGRSVFAANPGVFVAAITHGSTLIVEASAFDGSRPRATFGLAGLKEIISELDVCRRPSRPTQAQQRRRP